MMNLVEAVALDPLKPLSFTKTDGESGEYETKLLETTIEKITTLLRVGFGEAGANIIKANLEVKDGENTSAINPLLPGIRVYAVVGFCDIHHFDECLLLLERDVLTFVNSIAEIVHNMVGHWGGQCNKNLGNAFVIIWRIGDETTLHNQQNSNQRVNGRVSHIASTTTANPNDNIMRMRTEGSNPSPVRRTISQGTPTANNDGEEEGPRRKAIVIDLRRVPFVDALADRALIGYLKIIAEINRNPRVLAYRTEPRLTKNGTTEFKVRMGFGLHAGWAIEGAVGSIHKVDATYLSPHVNMAARLETSSRQYGVSLLASQNFYDLLSHDGQETMRRLDVVTVKGSEVPIGIYTYDTHQDQVFYTPQSRPTRNAGSATPGTPSVRREFLTNSSPTDLVFEKDSDMLQLRAHVTDEFKNLFADGINAYLNGDWPMSRNLLEKADTLMKRLIPGCEGDQPCKTILSYMEERNWQAPAGWKGFRPLTAK
jgi:class 3 adenylate cyclase